MPSAFLFRGVEVARAFGNGGDASTLVGADAEVSGNFKHVTSNDLKCLVVMVVSAERCKAFKTRVLAWVAIDLRTSTLLLGSFIQNCVTFIMPAL